MSARREGDAGSPESRDRAGRPARKPYARPALRVYGDAATLTRNISNTSTNADTGGHGNKSKTH